MATVSRALRGLDNVNQETQRLVEESARSLSYVVDSRASNLASGRIQFDHDGQQVLRELQVPFATVGYTTAGGHAIIIDEEAGARMATQHRLQDF